VTNGEHSIDDIHSSIIWATAARAAYQIYAAHSSCDVSDSIIAHRLAGQWITGTDAITDEAPRFARSRHEPGAWISVPTTAHAVSTLSDERPAGAARVQGLLVMPYAGEPQGAC